MWTLVGGGLKSVAQSAKPMGSVLPNGSEWIKQRAAQIIPEKNVVLMENGDEVGYEFLVVAVGLKLNYGLVSYVAIAFFKS